MCSASTGKTARPATPPPYPTRVSWRLPESPDSRPRPALFLTAGGNFRQNPLRCRARSPFSPPARFRICQGRSEEHPYILPIRRWGRERTGGIPADIEAVGTLEDAIGRYSSSAIRSRRSIATGCCESASALSNFLNALCAASSFTSCFRQESQQ